MNIDGGCEGVRSRTVGVAMLAMKSISLIVMLGWWECMIGDGGYEDYRWWM